jgi:hypothetical protein
MKSSARSRRKKQHSHADSETHGQAAEPEREQLEHRPWTRNDEDGDPDSQRVGIAANAITGTAPHTTGTLPGCRRSRAEHRVRRRRGGSWSSRPS